MNALALVRSHIEARFPAAFLPSIRHTPELLPTGIPAIDTLTVGGIPLNRLTEICASAGASSGKTSVILSLMAQVTRQGRFCAFVDASDNFDPTTAEAAGVYLPHMLWVRCGKSRRKLRPLEQAFKVTDMLLQSGGFSLIVVDLSAIAEKLLRSIPLSTWFRFSRVVEQQPTALVFLERQPHATSCAGLVLRLTAAPAAFSGKLMAGFTVHAEEIRAREKKGVQSASPDFFIRAQWA